MLIHFGSIACLSVFSVIFPLLHFIFISSTFRQLKQSEKPASLDLPFIPPMITITTNMSESDADISPTLGLGKPSGCHLVVPTTGMCYLSPFSICTRGDRTISESNLSSSGYSSMASPGPSRCGSSNPLNEMEPPGTGTL